MATFDLEAARKAGYSDDEIKSFLLSQPGVEGARSAGYSDDEILSHFGMTPKQMEGPLREPALAASSALKGLGESLGLPGTLTNLALDNPLIPEGMRKAQIHLGPLTVGYGMFPTGSDVTGITKSLGLTDRSDLIPQGDGEGYLAAGSEGAGAGAAFGPGGILPGVAGGTGAHLANELFPGNLAASIIGGLAGGMGAQGVLGSAERAGATRASAAELAAAEKTLSDLKASAMTERMTQGEVLRTAKDASRMKFDATRIATQASLDSAHNAAGAQIEGVAKQLSPAKTLQEAGSIAQAEARKWITSTLPAKVGALWAPVDAAIPTDAKVGLTNFSMALDDINSSAGALENVASKLKPSAPAGLKKALDAALLGQDEFSWTDVQKLRSALGDALANPTVIRDVGAQNLDRLYATLTKDMREAAQAHGALAEFDAANAGSRSLYSFAEGPISKIVAGARPSAEDPAPEEAAKRLLAAAKSGGTDLAALRGEVPSAVDAVAAAHLRTGDWGVLAPEARVALVADPAHRAALDGAGATRTSASESAAKTLEAARAARLSEHALAESDARMATLARAKTLEAARQRLQAAKAGASPTGPSSGRNALEMLTGGAVGTNLGVLGLNALGLAGSEIMHGAAGAVAGATIPIAAHVLANAVKNPNVLLRPAIGAAAGAEVGQ